MTKAPVDLSQLALDRSPPEASAKQPRPRRWWSRYVVPSMILVGFMVLLGAAAGRRLASVQSVTVVPVMVKRAAVQQAGTPRFQAAGWIEPRPTAVRVPALAPGVIEELMVVEGQPVSKDEPIARLISIDAELAVEQAEAALATREGELKRAQAERDAAQMRLDHPIHLRVQLADAESKLAKTKTELAKLPFLIDAGEANVTYTQRSVQGKRAAESAIAGRIVQQAESEHAAAVANVQELRQREPNLKNELDALQSKVDALQQQMDLLIEERRQLQEAEAKVQSALALRDEARLQLRQRKLAMRRNVIRSPLDGRVLRLVAAPGTRVMGMDSNAGQDSSTVVEMYDPQRLQVRADVRLEDVPLVIRGQPVEIETASAEGVIQGRVLQTTSSANIQKNTLEVKVEIIDPPPSVSPDMLVTATFMEPQPTEDSPEATERSRIFVPSQLIQSGSSGDFVWVVDSDDLAQQRPVEVSRSRGDGLVEVQKGLNVTSKLIVSGTEGLVSGSPVAVTGEDQTLGI